MAWPHGRREVQGQRPATLPFPSPSSPGPHEQLPCRSPPPRRRLLPRGCTGTTRSAARQREIHGLHRAIRRSACYPATVRPPARARPPARRMPPSVSASIPMACAYWPGAAQGGSRTLIFDRSNKKIVVWMKVEERFEVYIKDLQEQIDILAYSSIALAGRVASAELCGGLCADCRF